MAKPITKDLEVCTDCLMFIANGTTEDTATDAICAKACTDTLRFHGVPKGYLFAASNESGEGSFAWRVCDCCHRPEGGDRYKAGILA